MNLLSPPGSFKNVGGSLPHPSGPRVTTSLSWALPLTLLDLPLPTWKVGRQVGNKARLELGRTME